MNHAVELSGITKSFRVRSIAGSGTKLWALRGVSLAARAGETIGIVGESGCGKSTMARIICGLEQPDEGSVRLDGREVLGLRGERKRMALRNVQMVFQDPYGSLNPRFSVRRIISEPFMAFPDLVAKDRRSDRVLELLDLVGLSSSLADARPGELSGGQRQRVGIARAIAAKPKVLVGDEAVSALDVSVQAQVVNLLSKLVDELGLCLLFVAHDLRVVKNIAHRVAVMYLGRIVETGTTEQVFSRPRHPYTSALLSSVPPTRPWRTHATQRRKLAGEIPSPIDIPSGCGFRTRCWRAIDRCVTIDPPLDTHRETSEAGPIHEAACHNPVFENDAAEMTGTRP
jgi:oligopeptide/dipeptide ABC transporter ATP-binding protein